MNYNRGYEVKITVGGGVIKLKLIKLINSLFVHFINNVSDSTSQWGQSVRPRPQSALSPFSHNSQSRRILEILLYLHCKLISKYMCTIHALLEPYCLINNHPLCGALKNGAGWSRENCVGTEWSVTSELLRWPGVNIRMSKSIAENLEPCQSKMSLYLGARIAAALGSRARPSREWGAGAGAVGSERQWSRDCELERIPVLPEWRERL